VADVSQRELAAACGLAAATIGHAEAGRRDLPVATLARAAALAGLRLALIDEKSREVEGMSAEAVRDRGGRRFPAHLDTRHGDEAWWYDVHRYGRDRPWYTFDRSRRARNAWRARTGTPEDHQLPQPGDSPHERADRRRRERARLAAEERQRRFLAGEFATVDLRFDCTCPSACDDLDDRSGKPLHAPDCDCDCDLA
jgi:HTH-type transcriptional regulator/antitoxin HipB